jgi:hypothetical protein
VKPGADYGGKGLTSFGGGGGDNSAPKKKKEKENCPVSGEGGIFEEGREDGGKARGFVARGVKSWMIVTEKMLEAYTP